VPAAPRPAVTALRERPQGRVAVELDGAPWRVLPADAVVRARLAVGRPLDREQARELARALRRGRALALAARALGPRDRSRDELARRLELARVPAAARVAALDSLERAGLVDDARVAGARAAALAARGYGDAAISDDLARRGIGPGERSAALAALQPEPERARQLLERHGREPRALRRLAAHGFDPELLRELAGFADEA
jgi:SOS response regulatory protein OraA/RecX